MSDIAKSKAIIVDKLGVDEERFLQKRVSQMI